MMESIVKGRTEHDANPLHENLKLFLNDILIIFACIKLLVKLILLKITWRCNASFFSYII